MDRAFYLEYYQLEREHWWFKVRNSIIEQHLKKLAYEFMSGTQILNIGVASGKTTEILGQFGKVTTVEYDKECCDFVKHKLNIDAINASIQELPFGDNKFDLVCAFDVIEHVEDDQQAVEEMKRVCKHKGAICITVPAFPQLWSHHDEVNQHFRRYLMSGIKPLFSKAQNGTEIYSTYFNSFLFIPIYLFRLISHVAPARFFRKGAGSDFTISRSEGISSKLLYFIFSFERILLKYLSFPFGVSILYSWRKQHIEESDQHVGRSQY